MPAAVFHDNGASSGNYTTIGANTTFGGNVGMFGALGASPSMRVTYSGAAFVFEGAEKNLASTCTIFQFWYRPAAGATLGTGNSIFTACTTNLYNNATAPIRLDLTPSGSAYKFTLIDPSNAFAGSAGTTTFALGVPTRVVLVQSSVGWKLYLNNSTTPEITYTQTQPVVGMQYVCFGTLNENAAGSYAGIADFGEVWCGNQATAPTTPAGKIADAYNGYLQNHLALSGQPYRGVVDGYNYTSVSAIDTVSEGAAYLLKLAVQNNDQASFILCDNWILANLLRSNSTVANTQINAAPTNALSLMAFHYNSANTDGKGIGTIYDANWSADSEVERAQALFWAHARFGSSLLTVGSVSELLTPNYLQRGLNVVSDLRNYGFANSAATGYNYLLSDSLQLGNSVVQIAPDYVAPAAFNLFKNYDTANVTFWSNAILGAYDILTKASNTIFSGAPDSQASTVKILPSWLSFTVSTATVSTTRSTYGDPNYGFNCFRAAYRLYDQYVWSGDTAALTALQLPKPEWVTLWGSQAKIPATLNHDGSTLATYELSLFTYSAYLSIYANDNANTTATAINSGKLANLYSQQPYGSIISDIPAGQQYAYFGQSWSLVGYMQQNGLWINWGQLNARGGGTSTGTAALSVTKPIAATGGGVGSGTAGISVIKSIAAVGGGVGSGIAAIIVSSIIAIGGGTSSGTAAIISIKPIAATGGGVGTGTAVIALNNVVTATGGGTSSGSSSISVIKPITATGGGTSGGSAVGTLTTVITATGGGTSSGSSAIVAVPIITASGGGTSGGTAAIATAVVYAITATGGGTSGGTVAISDSELIASVGGGTSSGSSSIALTSLLTATGGGTSGGTASTTVTKPITATGGGTSSGTALLAPISYAITSTGGGTSTGTAALGVTESIIATGSGTSSGSAAITLSNLLTATGGGTSSGTATLSITQTIVATGGGTSGGTASMLAASYAITATGGGVGNGTTTLNNTVLTTATGGGTATGTASIAVTQPITATGGGVGSGSAVVTLTTSISAIGSGTSGGTVAISDGELIASVGGGTSGGSSSITNTNVITAAGSGTSGGTSTIFSTVLVLATGGGVSGGTAPLSVTELITATGSGTSGGTANISGFVSYAITATGGGTSTGSSSTTNSTNVLSIGGGLSGGTAAINVLSTYAITAIGGGTSNGVAAITSGTSYAITATGGGVSSGIVSINAVYVPLLPLTTWSIDAPYDATQLLYDNLLRAYDDSTIRYDGTDQTLLLPKRSSWNIGVAPLLGNWITGSQVIGSYSPYDSSTGTYDSSTMFYDGGQVGSAIKVTNWSKGASQALGNWVPGNQVTGSYSPYDSSTAVYDSPTIVYDGGQVGLTIEVTKWTPA